MILAAVLLYCAKSGDFCGILIQKAHFGLFSALSSATMSQMNPPVLPVSRSWLVWWDNSIESIVFAVVLLYCAKKQWFLWCPHSESPFWAVFCIILGNHESDKFNGATSVLVMISLMGQQPKINGIGCSLIILCQKVVIFTALPFCKPILGCFLHHPQQPRVKQTHQYYQYLGHN